MGPKGIWQIQNTSKPLPYFPQFALWGKTAIFVEGKLWDTIASNAISKIEMRDIVDLKKSTNSTQTIDREA